LFVDIKAVAQGYPLNTIHESFSELVALMFVGNDPRVNIDIVDAQ